jgi:hypothetical protein
VRGLFLLDEMKVCSKCKRSLPADKVHYFTRKGSRDGFISSCKECKGYKFTPPIKEGYKKCAKCKRILPKDKHHFYTLNQKNVGLNPRCRECLGSKFTIEDTTEEGYKICPCCDKKLPKTIEYFSIRKTAKDGFRNQCKDCKTKYNKVYHQENRDTISSQSKIYRRKNRDTLLQKMRTWTQENKEVLAIKKKAYRLSHPEETRIRGHNYRAKKRKLPHTLTVKQWETIKLHFNNQCAYCGAKTSLQQDHFLAVKKGGEYAVTNIIPACAFCNNSKNDNFFTEWYPKYKDYSKKREQKILRFLGYKNGVQQLTLV